MKIRLTAIMLSVLMSNVHAQDIDRDYATTLAKAINFVNQHPEQVWPGFSYNTPVTVDYFDFSHIYTLNLTPTNPHWEKLSLDDQPAYYLDHDEYGFGKDLCSNCTYMSKNAELDGQDTRLYVVRTNAGQDSAELARNIITDKFRQFFPYEEKYEKYDGFNQLDHMKLLYLEISAMNEYVVRKSEVALQDAVAIHQTRSQLLSKDSLNFQRELEVFSGYPYYVGLKSVYNSQQFADQLVKDAAWMCDIDFSTSGYFTTHICGTYAPGYVLSAAYSLGLDDKMNSKDWKYLAMSQHKSASMLLEEYYHMTDRDALSRVHSAMKNPVYDYAGINRQMDQYLKPYIQELTAAQEGYKNQVGIELAIETNFLGLAITPYEGTYDANYDISTTDVLFTNASRDNVSDNNNAEIHYHNIAYMHHSSQYPSENRLKVKSDTKLLIDGQADTVGNFVAAGKNVTFKNLWIENTQFKLKSADKNGKIFTQDGKLKLTFLEGKDATQNVGKHHVTIFDLKDKFHSKKMFMQQFIKSKIVK